MADYIVAAVLEEERHERIYLKQLRDASNPFERTERKFRKLFRFSRSQGRHIVDILSAGENNPLNSGTIPAHLKILSALNFMGHGSYQTAVGEINIIAQSQPSVSRSLTAVCNLVVERLLPNTIQFPITVEEKNKVMREFQENFSMPYTLGAVDGTHIGIHKPPLNHPTAPGSLFYNRKGFYSINCQVICDANGRIMSVNPNFPGSTHDAVIWRQSELGNSGCLVKVLLEKMDDGASSSGSSADNETDDSSSSSDSDDDHDDDANEPDSDDETPDEPVGVNEGQSFLIAARDRRAALINSYFA
ncbi:hypothetical protein O0L34_g15924 [Tuta absoluta]|nr:hypothetical protein O0L34_g15924 [Tuta absoluta]